MIGGCYYRHRGNPLGLVGGFKGGDLIGCCDRRGDALFHNVLLLKMHIYFKNSQITFSVSIECETNT